MQGGNSGGTGDALGRAGERDSERGTDALSVSAALALAKQSLEAITVRIIGEVSEVSVKAGYKAAYFTVKDSSASLPCMMWNNRYQAAGIQLRVGQLIELTGRFSLYAAKGRMNFDVFSIALAGEGDLRMKVADIARRLKAEGLTDQSRKRPLPKLPQRIGLVTSPRSAAVHDVLRTLRRRYPIAEVLLAGVPVEGAHAPEGLIEGLKCVVEAGAQVVLVVRGGGSFEDMMPFNDESLARAIAACPVPVVTGIGHEVDTSVADMVSDFRASTPTAAAEAVSPAPENFTAYFQSRSAALSNAELRLLERLRMSLDTIASRPSLSDPQLLFSADAQSLDIAAERLIRALPAQIERHMQAIDALNMRVVRTGRTLTDRSAFELSKAAARLEDLSPLGTLARGYSIVRDGNGRILKKADESLVGNDIIVTLAEGALECQVKAVAS